MINDSTRMKIRARIPGLLCLLVLCGILAAGLAPFRGQRNAVTWMENENGLRFAGYGTIWSSGSFQTTGQQDEDSCSIDLWLQPGLTSDSSTILSFSISENPLQFSLHQYRSNLIAKREVPGNPPRTVVVGIDGIFRQIRPLFITITSGDQETVMYVDGVVAHRFSRFRLGNDCRGQLVIGTSPEIEDSWVGQLLGVATYRRELTAAQVLKHYETWTTQGRPELTDDEHAAALYLFSERAGNVVHNSVPGGINLYIPKRYALVHQIVLQPFWKEYKPTWEHWRDILMNIAGFVPLGFVFCAYWSSIRPIKRAVLVTTLLGFAVSLTIEVLQSYIPTRNSGTTDLITNTLGTFLGAQLCDWKVTRDLLARIYGARLTL
jgi:VanZ family protein